MLSHHFQPLELNPIVCRVCKRNMLAHLASGKCDVCGKTEVKQVTNSTTGKTEDRSILEVVNGILVCSNCKSDEIEAAGINDTRADDVNGNKVLPEPIKRLEDERHNTPAIQFTNDYSALVDLPQNQNEFFNAETISIIELEKKILNDPDIPSANNNKWIFFAKQLQARQSYMQQALIKVIELGNETRNRNAALQTALNLLGAKLRKEERDAIQLKYADYVPAKPPIKVLHPRQSAQEKVIEGVAKMMFAPRKDGIIQWEALTHEEREACLGKARATFKGQLNDIREITKNDTSSKRDDDDPNALPVKK